MSKLLAPVVAGTLVLFGLSASGAEADSGGTVAQLAGFHQMAVDSSAGYIFLSGSGGIAVADLSGNTITTLDTGNQVAGLALSSDGGTLYAALTAGSTHSDSIGAIDVSAIKASSPTEGYYALGNGDVPYGLAFQGGELWVSYTDSSGGAGIGSFDPASGTFTAAAADGWTTAPDLAADSQAGGTTLVAVQPGSAAAAATYTTANGTITPLAAQTALGQCSGETQLAVAPGGADFIVACGTSVNEYSVSSLAAPQSSYAAGSAGPAGPAGAAIDADGTVAVGSSSGIYVYGSGGALDNIFNPGGSASLAAGGLGWEGTPNGSQLVAVADSDGSYSLQVFSQPTLTRSILTLTAPSTAVIGSQVMLTGSLTLSNGAPLPANTQVTITRTDPGSTTATPLPPVQPGSNGSFTLADTPPATAGTYTYTASYGGDPSVTAASTATTQVTVGLNTTALSLSGPSSVSIGKNVTLTGSLALGGGAAIPAGTTVTVTRTGPGSTGSEAFTVTPASTGGFTLTDAPTVAGAYTYTAKYAGNATIAAAAASHTVTVSPLATSLSITTGAMAFDYGTTIHVVAHLGATYTNRTVSIYAQWDGYRGKVLLKTGRVSASGELTVSYTAPRSTTFSAVFTGDAHYAAKAIGHDVGIRAKTTLSMAGYYGNRNIGGTIYRVYHQSGYLYVTVAVGPNKPGECARIEVQEHYSGAWRANELTACAALDGSSRLYGYLTVNNGDLGYEYRVRADYVRSSGDASNLSSDSGWQYIMPER